MSAMPGVPPAITAENAGVWDAGARGELAVEQCDGCGLHVFPPRGVCRRCYGRDLRLVPIEGPGIVCSHTVNRNAWGPDAPAVYSVVLVEFPDYSGVRFVGLYDDTSRPAAIGDPVDFALVPAFGTRFQVTFTPRSTR